MKNSLHCGRYFAHVWKPPRLAFGNIWTTLYKLVYFDSKSYKLGGGVLHTSSTESGSAPHAHATPTAFLPPPLSNPLPKTLKATLTNPPTRPLYDCDCRPPTLYVVVSDKHTTKHTHTPTHHHAQTDGLEKRAAMVGPLVTRGQQP